MENEYVEKIHKVIGYIQKNTDKQLSIKALANIAGFSQYYFHRIFSAYVGEPLSTFVKRQRLEKSAQKLIYTDITITDAALSVGYETPSAYTKAFKQFFGINPSEYKTEKNCVLKSERDKKYHNYLKGLVMKHFVEIREIQDEKVYYARKIGPYEKSGPEAFNELKKFIIKNNLYMPDVNPKVKLIGLSHDDPAVTEADKCKFDACITVTKDVLFDNNVNIQTIKGGKYAVFLHKGPYNEVVPVYHAICGEWLPNNNYKLRDLPLLEVYLNNPDNTKPEDLLTEIYLPIE